MRDKNWWMGFLVLCCAALLSACSPNYNWREVSVADGRVMALFPAKPATEQRSLAFEGKQLVFSMTQAHVDDDVFAVAYAPWGEAFLADAALRERVARDVMVSLYRNFGLTPPETLPAMGELFSIKGGPNHAMHLQAQVWVTSHGLIEGLVVTDKPDSTEHDVMFFDALSKQVGETLPRK